MREKINAQSQFDFEPSTLKLTNRYYAKYHSISSILDDVPAIVDAVHQDLKRPLKYTTVKGKDGGDVHLHFRSSSPDPLVPDHRRSIAAGDRHPDRRQQFPEALCPHL